MENIPSVEGITGPPLLRWIPLSPGTDSASPAGRWGWTLIMTLWSHAHQLIHSQEVQEAPLLLHFRREQPFLRPLAVAISERE